MFKTIVFVSLCLFLSIGMWAQELQVEEVRTIKNINDEEGIMNCVTFSPDGKLIATGCSTGVLTIWDAASGEEIRKIKMKGNAHNIRFTPDGKGVVCVNQGAGKIYFFTVKDGKEYLGFDAPGEFTLSFNKKGDRLLGARDQRIVIWDTNTGKQILEFKAGCGYAAFSADEKTIISGKGGKLFFWNAETGKELPEWKVPRQSKQKDIQRLAFSKDGKFIALSAAKMIGLWDVEKQEIVNTFEGFKDIIRNVAFSDNGEYLLAGNDDKTARLIVVSTGKYYVCSGHAHWVISVAFSPDGTTFASASRDKSVKIWKIIKK